MLSLKEVQRAMTYGSLIVETIQVGKYQIEFCQDQDSESPYDAWEGNCPAIWVNLARHSTDLSEHGDSDLGAFFGTVSDHWISRHWRAIAKILDLNESAHDQEARVNAAEYGQSLSESRADLFRDALGDKLGNSWSYALDYLESLKSLYRLAGVQCETFQRDGYSQGDSVYGLIVMTPAWLESVGFKADRPSADCAKDMKSQADIYGAWCWGDVFGYILQDQAGNEIDSCCPFYGDNLEDSGMWDSLSNAIECHESQALSRQLAKVKAWIKAKTPLAVRADLLAAAC